MRTNYLLFVAVTLFALSSEATYAQVRVDSNVDLVAQYIEDETPQQYNSAWWNALGRQLTLGVAVPVEEVGSAQLQNIIYFTTHFRKQVRLDDATPYLVDVFTQHPAEEIRIMAAAALHAIRTEAAMRSLHQALAKEPSERVLKIARAAVVDYYRAMPSLAVQR